MAHVSLILPTTDRLSVGSVAPLKLALEDAGHTVEVLIAWGAAIDPGESLPATANWRTIAAGQGGLAAAAVAGLIESDGELVVLLDPTMQYTTADLLRVLGPLAAGEAELVVASRCLRGEGPGPVGFRDRLRAGLGRVSRPVTGTTDPMSGLMGLTREAIVGASARFRPAGAHFSFEILAKVEGRWLEVPVATGPTRRRDLPGLDEFRHLKRMADHRFGNLSRLLQFCVVGASGMVIDLACYALFQWLFTGSALTARRAPLVGGPLDLAVAGALAIAIALTWNFFLNRRLTFNDARNGSILRQYLTYALSNALGISLSLSLRLLLPRHVAFFDAHRLAAAVVGIVVATGVSFTMARWLVFQPSNSTKPPPSRPKRPQSGGPQSTRLSIGV